VPPTCTSGEQLVEIYDASGCLAGYKCVADDGAGCTALAAQYGQALQQAKACAPFATNMLAQCTLPVADALICGGCTTFVNTANGAAVQRLKDLQTKFDAQGCGVNVMCPAIACVAPTGASCEARSDGGGACQDLPAAGAPR
jgi:hypothetical protein